MDTLACCRRCVCRGGGRQEGPRESSCSPRPPGPAHAREDMPHAQRATSMSSHGYHICRVLFARAVKLSLVRGCYASSMREEN
eukprot:2330725-Amphidinium_carterae.1